MLVCGLLLPQPLAAARLRADRNHLPSERSDPGQVNGGDASSSAAEDDGKGDNPKARAEWFRQGRSTAPGQEAAASKLQREISRKVAMRISRLARGRSLSPSTIQPPSSLVGANAPSASASI